VRRSHKRPRAAALLPPFRHTRIASSLKLLGRSVGGGTNGILASPPLAEKDWLTAEETSAGTSAREPDARSDLRSGRRPLKAPPDPSRLNDRDLASDRPSIGTGACCVALPGSYCGSHRCWCTLGWQSYQDAAKEMVIVRAPTLAWLLSISATKPPVVATTSPGSVQQLEPLAFVLDIVRRSVEQLATKQEQMAQNIVALQAVEEDIRQKMSSTPPSPAPPGGLYPSPHPRNTGSSHRLRGHRRCLARRLPPDHSSRTDGPDRGRGKLTSAFQICGRSTYGDSTSASVHFELTLLHVEGLSRRSRNIGGALLCDRRFGCVP
jgi:hypothetical protein